MNNESGGVLIISEAYIEMPENVRVNEGPNKTLGEGLFEKGKNYLFTEPVEMGHYLSGAIEITDKGILEDLSNAKFNPRLIVKTSRFGRLSTKRIKSKYFRNQ